MTLSFYVAILLFLLICLLLCGLILLQEGKGSLGAAFGAGEGSQSLFGTSTVDVLKKITAYLACFFLLSCLFLSFWTSSLGKEEQQAKPNFDQEAS